MEGKEDETRTETFKRSKDSVVLNRTGFVLLKKPQGMAERAGKTYRWNLMKHASSQASAAAVTPARVLSVTEGSHRVGSFQIHLIFEHLPTI